MSTNTNGVGGDGTDIIWLSMAGMFLLGTEAFAVMADNALGAVKDFLLGVGLLVPAAEAAFELGDAGVGVSMPVVLGAAGLLVGIVVLAAYLAARKRARGQEG